MSLVTQVHSTVHLFLLVRAETSWLQDELFKGLGDAVLIMCACHFVSHILHLL